MGSVVVVVVVAKALLVVAAASNAEVVLFGESGKAEGLNVTGRSGYLMVIDELGVAVRIVVVVGRHTSSKLLQAPF